MARVELSTGLAGALVPGMAGELLLFAAVGIALIGLDDLALDLLWLRGVWRARRSGGPWRATLPLPPVVPGGRLAVLVPAWQESGVLADMLVRTLAQWAHDSDFVIYVGCYPNDPETLFSVSPLIARDARLRLVIAGDDGPTTKGDNLNELWQAVVEDERAGAPRVAGVVLHDAEDWVHADELAAYRCYLSTHAMVQLPVRPGIHPRSRWIAGHYADEFAEAHAKEMVVRSHRRAGLPSAGVGCMIARPALEQLAQHRGGLPFDGGSLTEDYELGLACHRLGLPTVFARLTGRDGSMIVSGGLFPATLDGAVRQKARWTVGMALAGWDRLGWGGGPSPSPAGAGWQNRLLARWMLWRDRRAPLSAVVLVAAYATLGATTVAMVGARLFGWPPLSLSDPLRALLVVNALLLGWRLLLRALFTGAVHGPGEAVRAVPRALVGNIIAMMAARRAVVLYVQMLRETRPIWDKTTHEFAVPVEFDAVHGGRRR